MSVAPRLNSITYNSLKIGEGTSYTLIDATPTARSHEELGVQFGVLIRSTSESGFKTLNDAFIAAYTVPNKDLKMTYNSSDWVDVSQSSNTGLNARPRVDELPTHRSNLSRAYACSISLVLPATSGKSYRRDFTTQISVSVDASGVKSLRMSAEYTAGGGATAYANASTNFVTYVGTITSALTGTWDTSDEIDVTYDDENKIATAVATRQELIHAQSGSATDDTQLSRTQYTIRCARVAVPQFPGIGAHDWVTTEVAFSSPVRKSQTTDLDALITDTIEPYLKEMVEAETDAPGGAVLASLDYVIDPMGNSVSGTATYRHGDWSIVKASLRIQQDKTEGKLHIPVADGKDGYTYSEHRVPIVDYLMITWLVVALGDKQPTSPLDAARKSAEQNGYTLVHTRMASEPFSVTVQGRTGSVTYRETAISITMRKVNAVGGGAGGGAGRGLSKTSARTGVGGAGFLQASGGASAATGWHRSGGSDSWYFRVGIVGVDSSGSFADQLSKGIGAILRSAGAS